MLWSIFFVPMWQGATALVGASGIALLCQPWLATTFQKCEKLEVVSISVAPLASEWIVGARESGRERIEFRPAVFYARVEMAQPLKFYSPPFTSDYVAINTEVAAKVMYQEKLAVEVSVPADYVKSKLQFGLIAARTRRNSNPMISLCRSLEIWPISAIVGEASWREPVRIDHSPLSRMYLFIGDIRDAFISVQGQMSGKEIKERIQSFPPGKGEFEFPSAG